MIQNKGLLLTLHVGLHLAMQPTQPICVTKLFRVEDALSKFEQFQQLVYASLLV